jgi:hypothetical protein
VKRAPINTRADLPDSVEATEDIWLFREEDWDAVPREGEEVDVGVAHTDPLSISSSIGHLSSFT